MRLKEDNKIIHFDVIFKTPINYAHFNSQVTALKRTATTCVRIFFKLTIMDRKIDGIEEETNLSKMEEGSGLAESNGHAPCGLSPPLVTIIQKMIAELIGTYFVIFAGCGAVAVNKIYGQVTFAGVCVTWGMIVMVMIYSLGHISGAHFNPAVTITLAIFRQFEWRRVPLYIVAQVIGSLLGSGTLSLMLDVTPHAYFGTVPVGSKAQSFVVEIIITFLLMFVISGAVNDKRAIGEFGGIAVGMTIMLNVFVAGPISGASMNPARSIGPAIVKHEFEGLWLYILGPIIGAVAGGFAYNLIGFTDKPLLKFTKSTSFLKS